MINQDPNPSPFNLSTVINTVPVGSYAPVFRSGDACKAVGAVVKRVDFPELSTAFPRNGSFSSLALTLPQAGLKSSAYGNGVFVVVTATGHCLVSKDGVNFNRFAMPVAGAGYCSVTFGNGVFVAVFNLISGTGTTLSAVSTDGMTWTTATTLPNANWGAVAFGGGVFVAVANTDNTNASTNIAATSTDGLSWTPRTLSAAGRWSAVGFGNGVFVAGETSSGALSTSNNSGVSWTARSAVNVQANSVAYGAGLLVVAGPGGIITSADGVAWTSRKYPNISTPSRVCFGNGVFVAGSASVSPSVVYISYNGIAWETKPIENPATATAAVAFGGGTFIVLSDAAGSAVYAENLTDSDYLYLSGTPGAFVRVK